MTTLDPRSKALVDDFAKQPSVTPSMVADLQNAIETSPLLREQLAATMQGDPDAVRAIRLTPPGTNAGGFYRAETGAIHVSPDMFDASKFVSKTSQIDNVTGVVAHELGHAQRRQGVADAAIALDYAVHDALRDTDRMRVDLTRPFAEYLGAMRGEEAQAEMLSINAVASRVVADLGPRAAQSEVLGRIAETTTCVERLAGTGAPRWADGLQADSNHQLIGRSPETLVQFVDGMRNTAAVAECYAGHEHGGLGAGGKSNYASYYGAYVVSTVQAAAVEQRLSSIPEVALDFKALGIDAGALQSNQPPMPHGPMVLVDTSSGREQRVALQPMSTAPGTAPDAPGRLDAPDAPRRAAAAPPSVGNPALLETLREHCAAVGREHGWQSDNVDRAASALYVQCRQQYVDRIDGVVFGVAGSRAAAGDNLFAYGKQANGVDDRVFVATREAMATPATESLQQAQQIEHQQQLEQQQYQQQQNAQQHSGPSMSL